MCRVSWNSCSYLSKLWNRWVKEGIYEVFVYGAKDICSEVFSDFEIEYCYLFGSYAKGKATENSDIDLLISTTISGMQFYDLVEVLREKLKKKVDVLNREHLNNNADLTNEILIDGVKIYV